MNVYQQLILAGSFTVGDGKRVVNCELVNAVAVMWAKNERGINALEQTEQGKDVYPL